MIVSPSMNSVTAEVEASGVCAVVPWIAVFPEAVALAFPLVTVVALAFPRVADPVALAVSVAFLDCIFAQIILCRLRSVLRRVYFSKLL